MANPTDPSALPAPGGAPSTTDTPAGAAPELEAGAGAGARIPTSALPNEELLKFRLDRERERGEQRAREQLFGKYGVKSDDELDAKLKRIAELEKLEGERAAKDEEAKRASMSEVELVKTDLATARTKIAELEVQLAAARNELGATKQGLVVRSAAAEYVDADMLDVAEMKFAAHIRALKASNPERIAKYEKQAEVRAFFADLVVKNPKLAKEDAAASAAAAQAAAPKVLKLVPRKPVSTGVRPAGAVPPSPSKPAAPNGGKTMRPGQPNSMTAAELREHVAKKYGPGVRVG